MASVNLAIEDAKGTVVLTVPSTGPICLIKLPDSSHAVEAQAMGKTKAQRIVLGGGGGNHLLELPEPTPCNPIPQPWRARLVGHGALHAAAGLDGVRVDSARPAAIVE